MELTPDAFLEGSPGSGGWGLEGAQFSCKIKIEFPNSALELRIGGLVGRVVGRTGLIHEFDRADSRLIRPDSEFADRRLVEN